MRHDAELLPLLALTEAPPSPVDHAQEHWLACACLVELESDKPLSELPIKHSEVIRPGWPRDHAEAVPLAWSPTGAPHAICRMSYPMWDRSHPQYLVVAFDEGMVPVGVVGR